MIFPGGILLDLDGVIYQNNSLIDGAVSAISALDRAGVPYRFITNTSRMTKSNLINYLKKMDFYAKSENLFTAPHAAVEYCRTKGFKKISLVVPDSEMKKDFSSFDLVEENPEAVVLGDMGHLFTFELLNNLFLDVMNGCQVIAMHKNRYWLAADGLRMDLGAFVSALEYATGRPAVIIGKPDPNIFMLAAMEWECSYNSIYVVGDDIDADICGAKNAGMRSVLVKTGKFREEIMGCSKIKPDFILDSIASLPGLFKLC